MKKTLKIVIVSILLSGYSFSQNLNVPKDIKYFDENYSPISKKSFEEKSRSYSLLAVEGDSINHKVLTTRERRGRLKNRKYLDSLLTLSTNQVIDSSKPLVIVYYPGKDLCNSTGSATRRTIKTWFKRMEKGVSKIKKSNIVYVYKTKEGLYGRNDGFKSWIKDPEQIIEKLFFKKDYPCNSFVVISETNEFLSYFGEFGKDEVWGTMKRLTKR